METNFKVKTIRDKKHLEFVRKISCCVCSAWPVEASHIRKNCRGGTGMKSGDNFVLPVCSECHRFSHNVGEITFWGDIEKPIELANALWINTGNLEYAKERVALFRRSIRI